MAKERYKKSTRKGGIIPIRDKPAMNELAGNLISEPADQGEFAKYLNDKLLAELSEVLTVDEVAAFLRVSRPTIYRLIKTGELRPRRVGKRWRFSKQVIIRWIGGMQHGA